jgi:cytochrome P450
MTYLTPLVLTLAILTPITYFLYNRFIHPLQKIPGPFVASLTPLWLVYQSRTLQRHRIEMSLHKQYGPIVRIAPNEISVSDPKYMKMIYGANSSFLKSRWYEPIASTDPDGMNLLGEFDMGKYRMQIRLIGPAFSIDAVKKRESLLDKPMEKFVAKMKRMAGAVDLVKWMNILALDLLTEITFGESRDYISLGHDDGNGRDIDIFWQQIQWVGIVPEFWKCYVSVADWLSGVGLPIVFKASTEGLDIIQVRVYRFLCKRLSADVSPQYYIKQLTLRATTNTVTTPDRADLASDIQRLVASHPTFKPQWAAVTTVHIIAAGFDTLGMTLSACLAHIAKTPGCQKLLHAELDKARNNGILDIVPSYDQTATLPYLQACLKESMRLTSVIGVSLPRIVPPSATVIDGHAIPAGTVIGMNPWIIHRNKAIYGEDADSFRPERYIEASKSLRFEMDAHSLAFGGPSRSCPGKHLAWITLSKAIATIFSEFEVEVLSESEAEKSGGGEAFREECFFVVKWYGVWIRLRARGRGIP